MRGVSNHHSCCITKWQGLPCHVRRGTGWGSWGRGVTLLKLKNQSHAVSEVFSLFTNSPCCSFLFLPRGRSSSRKGVTERLGREKAEVKGEEREGGFLSPSAHLKTSTVVKNARFISKEMNLVCELQNSGFDGARTHAPKILGARY